MSALRELGRPAMISLAGALEGGRLMPPFGRSQLRGHVPDENLGEMRAELRRLSDDGMTPGKVALVLRLLAEERAAGQAVADRVELVWSGLEVMPGASRSTAIVVQELFREARESVLIASYALDSGAKAEILFGPLAARMDNEPALHVRLCVNIHREYGDKTADAVLVREFSESFRGQIWPGDRLPEVYYDPRSLSAERKVRACLHAKCIVIDEARALITSANFTEAAHERNIEAGTVITDVVLARGLKAQFDTLVDHGILAPVAGI